MDIKDTKQVKSLIGKKVKMVYGCYDDYEVVIEKVLKYKIKAKVFYLNRNSFSEPYSREFEKEYVRSIVAM